MTATASTKAGSKLPNPRRSFRLVQRNLMVYRHTWMVIFTGFFEPLFYLLALGLGVGDLIDAVPGPGGKTLTYKQFVGPGLLAASCMNGAISDGFFNIFFKLHFQRTYEGILATPLRVADVTFGEMMWALTRGTLYATGFLLILWQMDVLISPWAWLALPAAVLISASFSAFALAITSFVKKIQQFDVVLNLLVMPMFLFSTTFFPLSQVSRPLQIAIQASPLYHAISLLRALTTGAVGWDTLIHIAVLLGLLVACLALAMFRLEKHIMK